MKRLILSIFLVLSLCSSAIGEEIISRGADYDLYKVDGNTRRIEIGGPVSNAEPFNTDGAMVPETYKWSDVENLGGNIYRLSKGKFGYTVNIGATAQGGLAGGEIRIHPIRKRWDVYYSIAPQNPVALNYQQISDKLLELYKDTSEVRYSFFIGDRGFKVNTLLKANYTGGDEWSYTYNVSLSGLSRSGRKILFNGVAVGNLPDPYMTDSSGLIDNIFPVTESLNGGQLTVTATGLSTKTLPVNIDPTLGPILPSKDTFISGVAPTTGYGQQVFYNTSPGEPLRALLLFDISAIPAGSTITSSTFEQYYWTFGVADPGGLTVELNRCTRTDWEDAGVGTVGAEANWTNFKDPNVPWTIAGGDYTITDQVTSTVPATVGNWESYTPTAMTQYALDNESGLLCFLNKMQTEGGGPKQTAYYSLEQVVNADKRPKLTITYTVPSTTINTHLGYEQMVF